LLGTYQYKPTPGHIISKKKNTCIQTAIAATDDKKKYKKNIASIRMKQVILIGRTWVYWDMYEHHTLKRNTDFQFFPTGKI
jgi:hypothetical protein